MEKMKAKKSETVEPSEDTTIQQTDSGAELPAVAPEPVEPPQPKEPSAAVVCKYI